MRRDSKVWKSGWAIATRDPFGEFPYIRRTWATPEDARAKLLDFLSLYSASSPWWRKLYLVQVEEGRVVARVYLLPPVERREQVQRLRSSPACVVFIGGSGGSPKPWP